MTRITIIEDNRIVAKKTAEVINSIAILEVVSTYHSAEEALLTIFADRPDIILMDIVLPEMNGIECMVRIKAIRPEIAFLMFTTFEDDQKLFDALRFGANGYILKSDRIMGVLQGIKNYLNGYAPMSPSIASRLLTYYQEKQSSPIDGHHEIFSLTSRQLALVRLIAKGLQDKEIADRLGNTHGTIRGNVSKILSKLQLSNRTELAMLWQRHFGGDDE